MLEVAVIADDLTGAAETGAAFLRVYHDARLVDGDHLAGLPSHPAAPVLAVNTRSRSLSAQQAMHHVKSITGRLMIRRPNRVFKKIDSSLRGNLGSEVDAVMDVMGFSVSIIAPSYPEMGRTTIGDIHLVNGKPIAAGEPGQNEAEVVRKSRVTLAIAAQSRHSVGHVDIKTISAGAEPLRLAVERLTAKGIRHIVFDATERWHLAEVATLALKCFPTALLVGSGGLANALCDQLPRPHASIPAPLPAAAGRHLIVVGTASTRARCQIEKLQRTRHAETVMVDPDCLAATKVAPDKSVLSRLVTALKRGDVVVCIAPPTGKNWVKSAHQVVKGFGMLIAAATLRCRPASLFLSGGDTAFSVLTQLGIRQLKLERAIAPGLVLSTVVQCPFRGLVVGTKPGSFGDDDALLCWRNTFA